ncbi:MAG: hypothetical protein ACE5EH_07645 [Gammaproteobacteria bacterium]
MTCKILTEDRWSQLLQGRLSKEEKALVFDHLEFDCPDCEYIFERMDEKEEKVFRDIINNHANETERASQAEHRPSVAAIGDTTQHVNTINENNTASHTSSLNVGHQHHEKQGFFASLFSGSSHTPLWAGSFAVLVLLVVGIMPRIQNVDQQPAFDDPMPLQFEKGIAGNKVFLGLQYATGRIADRNEFVVDRGVIGGQVNSSDLLFIHYDLPTDGYVYILGYQPKTDDVSLIYPQEQGQSVFQSSGNYDVPSNGEINGIPLSNADGRYFVLGIYSSTALEDIHSIIPDIKKSIDTRTGFINEAMIEAVKPGISLDVIYFDVKT